MPKAPLYNGPQVAPQQLQGGMLSTNVADMSGIGRGLTQLGQGLNSIYLAERQKAEDEQLTQALSKARELQTNELYDPDNGIMYKQGGDLFSIAQDRLTGFRDKLNGIREGLGSTRVKQQFDRASDSLWQEYNRGVQMRIGSERVKTSEAVFDGAVQSERDGLANTLWHGTAGISGGSVSGGSAVGGGSGGSRSSGKKPGKAKASGRNYGDAQLEYDDDLEPVYEEPFLNEIDSALHRVSLYVKDKIANDPGGAPEGRAAAIQSLYKKEAGKTVVQAIDILLKKGNTADAKKVMDTFGDLVPAEHKASAIQATHNGVFVDDAQASADAIVAFVREHNDTLPNQEHNAIKRAEEMHKNDAKMRDEVIKRISSHFAREQDYRRQANDESFKNYYERLNNGEKFDSLFKERAFHDLTPSHQQQIERRAYEIQTGKDLGEDQGKLYRYEMLAKNNDPKVREAFRRMDLTKQDLTPKEFARVAKWQMDLQEANVNQAKDAEQKGVRTVHQIAEDTAKTFITDPKDRYLFQQQLEEQVAIMQSHLKRPIYPKEVQDLANDLLLRKATGFFTSKPVYKLTPEEIAAPDAKINWGDIPEKERSNIRRKWKILGRKPPTDEQIQMDYFEELRNRQKSRGIKFQE